MDQSAFAKVSPSRSVEMDEEEEERHDDTPASDASHVGEMRDDIWRAQHRADNIFGKSDVETMRYYGLFKVETEVKPRRAPKGGEGEEREEAGEKKEEEEEAGEKKEEEEGEGEKKVKTRFEMAARVVEGEMNNALMQMLRELIANCADLVHKDPTFRRIKVDIDPADGSICVLNDGAGMPVGKGLIKVHDKARQQELEREWSPTLLLARFGCSSNYDDSKVRMTAGKNGLGAKAVFAWSSRVEVRIVDSTRHKSFQQTWRDGMRDEGKAVVRAVPKTRRGMTEIKVWPNYERLVKLPLPLSPEQVAMLRWCVWECCTVLPPRSEKYGVTVDGVALPNHSAEGIVNAVAKIAFPSAQATILKHAVEWENELNGEKFKESLSCFAMPMHGSPMAVSDLPPLGFVNGITCPKGSHRLRATSGLCAAIGGKVQGVTSSTIQNSMLIVPCAMINQPSFSGQTKDELASKFPGHVSTIGVNIQPLSRCGYIQYLREQGKRKEGEAAVSKLEVTKSGKGDVDVKNYEGAMDAGRGSEDNPCFLFVTEGLSAQNCARNVIARLPLSIKRRSGSYALRGKIINCMNNTDAKIWSNEEIKALVKIANLDPRLTYEDEEERRTLRYHRLVLWTDADTDGGHIAWLVFLFVYRFWPRLAEHGFVQRFVTPLLKIWPRGGGAEPMSFYSEAAHDKWLEGLHRGEGEEGEEEEACGPGGVSVPQALATADMVRRALDVMASRSGKVKYYKGLGRLGKDDEAELARRFDQLCIRIDPADDKDLIMAIGSDGPEERRKVQAEREVRPPDYDSVDHVTAAEFVDGELLPYMREANVRSIPGIDGFSEASRMVLAYFYATGKAEKWGEEEVVARLAARIAAEMDYHHGEASMSSVITTMAQDFAGKNNLNLLSPNGQFGTRVEPQAAAPRYTNTAIARYTAALFPPDDYPALPMNRHGTVPTFVPGVMPMVLVNGATGIGYGHSSDVPGHHPRTVLDACKRWCAALGPDGVGEPDMRDVCRPFVDMQGEARAGWREWVEENVTPWCRGLRVQPEKVSDGRFESRGAYEVSEDGSQIVITELPCGTWTKAYKENVLSKAPFVRSAFMDPLTVTVRVTANVAPTDRKAVLEMHADGRLQKLLRLSKPVTYNNMKIFDRAGRIRAFSSPADVIEEFAVVRLWVYARRKFWTLRKYRVELDLLESRAKFLEVQVRSSRPVELRKYTEDKAYAVLEREGVPKVNGSYAHLSRISVWNLTTDKMEKTLEEVRQCRAAIEALEARSLVSLWLEDLAKAEAALQEHWTEDVDEPIAVEAAAAKKGAGRKRKAGEGGVAKRRR